MQISLASACCLRMTSAALSSLARSLPASTTVQPRAAITRADSCPSPDPAPVTMATLPEPSQLDTTWGARGSTRAGVQQGPAPCGTACMTLTHARQLVSHTYALATTHMQYQQPQPSTATATATTAGLPARTDCSASRSAGSRAVPHLLRGAAAAVAARAAEPEQVGEPPVHPETRGAALAGRVALRAWLHGHNFHGIEKVRIRTTIDGRGLAGKAFEL
eukprot:365744-Chlamydomonas_euryale.AAC.10